MIRQYRAGLIPALYFLPKARTGVLEKQGHIGTLTNSLIYTIIKLAKKNIDNEGGKNNDYCNGNRSSE